MQDVYLTIGQAAPAVIEELARVLELRAADPQQGAMRDANLADLGLPSRARVLEVGCGTGAVCRALAELAETGEVVGVDPSPGFLDIARSLADALPNVEFVEGDAKTLPLADGSFDAVVFHTTLRHVPEPEVALGEAVRALRRGGRLAIFDGDYATLTCAMEARPLAGVRGGDGGVDTSTTAGSPAGCRSSCSTPASTSSIFAATATSRPRRRPATCSPSSIAAPMP